MAISRVFYTFFLVLALFFAVVSPAALAQSSPAPAPASASSDGTTIDQGIAYVLMLLALALTYIIH